MPTVTLAPAQSSVARLATFRIPNPLGTATFSTPKIPPKSSLNTLVPSKISLPSKGIRLFRRSVTLGGSSSLLLATCLEISFVVVVSALAHGLFWGAIVLIAGIPPSKMTTNERELLNGRLRLRRGAFMGRR
jgi:hypothetical protein